ncbi:MAG: YceI family protein [Bacteroidota bacterium]
MELTNLFIHIPANIAIASLMLGAVLHGQPSIKFMAYPETSTYHIAAGSSLKLEGKTNINQFTCGCKQQFAPQEFRAEWSGDKNTLAFTETVLKLKIQTFDCGNKLMNKDLYKTLNAEANPNISIEIKKASFYECNPLDANTGKWVKLKVLSKITLNGKSNDYWLDIIAQKTASDKFRFIGAKKINMSEFGITPPSPFMGMIKVADEIKIDIDLNIRVEE